MICRLLGVFLKPTLHQSMISTTTQPAGKSPVQPHFSIQNSVLHPTRHCVVDVRNMAASIPWCTYIKWLQNSEHRHSGVGFSMAGST